MKREEALKAITAFVENYACGSDLDGLREAIEALKEMSVEEYRQRLMELFHITDHDELITFVVMPKEEEFKSLEYILRQYKFEPRLHGEWIFHDTYTVCGNCGKHFPYKNYKKNFCDECGADMREGEAK